MTQVEEARMILESNGIYSLFDINIADIMNRFDCGRDLAIRIAHEASYSDYINELIWEDMNYYYDEMKDDE